MTPKQLYNNLLAQKIIKELEKRNMDGYYYETKEDALEAILKMIPKDNLISCGGSETLHELGIQVKFKKEGYNFLDPLDAKGSGAKDKVAHEALTSDYYLMSTNAISFTGELVNIDGYGNRVSSLIFGPKNVIVIAGMNKVVPNLDSAILRAKSYCAPNTMLLFNKNYTSFDELHEASQGACSQLVITSMSAIKGRIKVILIGENLGF